jgi:hypothetical protein
VEIKEIIIMLINMLIKAIKEIKVLVVVLRMTSSYISMEKTMD